MINWANLVEKGRAKAIGVAWNEDEIAALDAGVPADFVRDGILSLEKYKKVSSQEEEKTVETGEKPVARMSKPELVEKAKSLGLEFGPEATIPSLREIINSALSSQEEEEEEEEDEEESEDNDK